MEMHDHLFFGCNFSREVWKVVLQLWTLNECSTLGCRVELGSKKAQRQISYIYHLEDCMESFCISRMEGEESEDL